MSFGMLKICFDEAKRDVDHAIFELKMLRSIYAGSQNPHRAARIRALDAKIDALAAVQLDSTAVPWCEDT